MISQIWVAINCGSELFCGCIWMEDGVVDMERCGRDVIFRSVNYFIEFSRSSELSDVLVSTAPMGWLV